jgi:DNA polymerase III epsilon subunit-like protein
VPPTLDLPLHVCTFVFLDVETSGLRPDRGARLTEIAALGRRSSLLDWRAEAGNDAALAAVWPDLRRCLHAGLVVGHHLAFDLRFLAREAERLRLPGGLDVRFIDTLPLARRLVSGVPDYRLGTLLSALGLVPEGPLHTAVTDAAATRDLFWALVARGSLATAAEAGLQRARWRAF